MATAAAHKLAYETLTTLATVSAPVANPSVSLLDNMLEAAQPTCTLDAVLANTMLSQAATPVGWVKLTAGVTRQVRTNRKWLKGNKQAPKLAYTEDGGKTWKEVNEVKFLGEVRTGSHQKVGHCTMRFWTESEGAILVK